MGFEKATTGHRATEPSVTFGKGNKINFSAPLLKAYDPDKTRRVSVFIDVTTRRVGFGFGSQGDLKISKMNQIQCGRIFRDLVVEGDGTRYPARPYASLSDAASEIQCYIEVPK